jgi:hypothetical protein
MFSNRISPQGKTVVIDAKLVVQLPRSTDTRRQSPPRAVVVPVKIALPANIGAQLDKPAAKFVTNALSPEVPSCWMN